MPTPTVRRLRPEEAHARIEALADILVDAVDSGASVTFLRPLVPEKALRFWQGVAEGVARGDRALLVAEDADGTLLGTVQLFLATPENQPHRAEVAKMLVHRRARRRGVGALLLEAVEQVAREEGRTLLILDTVTGGDADRLYTRGGWTRLGDVPGYALLPDGTPGAATFFYKALAR
jgi:GNAT superfamily N-acetyltransferase